MLMPARGWQARKSNLCTSLKPIKVFVGGLGGGVFQKEPLKVLAFDFMLLTFASSFKKFHMIVKRFS